MSGADPVAEREVGAFGLLRGTDCGLAVEMSPQPGQGSMNNVVDRVMTSYEKLPAIEGLAREEIRVKVGQYLAKLSSAGHSETDELIYYGLAYLRILHEGPDPRYTGC